MGLSYFALNSFPTRYRVCLDVFMILTVRKCNITSNKNKRKDVSKRLNGSVILLV